MSDRAHEEQVKLISVSPNNEYVLLQKGNNYEERWVESKTIFEDKYQLIANDIYEKKDCD